MVYEIFRHFSRDMQKRRNATGRVRGFVSTSVPGIVIRQINGIWRGYSTWRRFADWPNYAGHDLPSSSTNDLRSFCEARREGRGIWKWTHYFDIYDRHFGRFRGRDVRVLEIGVYSGGSLEMWKAYFGARSQIYGVDIEPSCKAYEGDSVRVFIGDQGDRDFWRRFREEVGAVDIVIDDGGHFSEQQIVSLEELLPYLRPGGVYLCEDVVNTFNRFAGYVHGLAYNLNTWKPESENLNRRVFTKTTALQSAIRSVHLYPFVVVIERTDAPISELVAPKHGSVWASFLK